MRGPALSALLLLLLLRGSARAATCYVSPSGADGSACDAAGTPCQTLSRALGVCSGDGDVLNLAQGTYTGPLNRDLTLSGRSVTIEGTADSTVLDAQGSGRHFNVTNSAHLTLSKLTLANGVVGPFQLTATPNLLIPGVSGGGGSIRVRGSSLTTADCKVRA